MQNLKVRIQIHDLLFFLLLVFSFYFTRNALCRIMMVVFFGYTVVRQLRNKRKLLYSSFYLGSMIFIIYGLLNVFFDNVINAQVARTMVISLALNFLMIYAIVQYIYMQNNVQKVLRITEWGIFTTSFAVMLLSMETITSGRLGGGTEINANMLAMLSVYGLVLCVYLKRTGFLSSNICRFRIVFYMLVILLTGSRKGLIMVFLAAMIINFINGRRKLVKNVLICITTAVVAYLVIMNVRFFYNIIGVRVESLILLLTEGTVTEGSLKSRLELVEIAMPYIRQKPWTGYGYDCFKLISGMNGQGKVTDDAFGYYSHNNYIELLFGGGIVGFVLYYIPILHLLKKLCKKIGKNTSIPYLLALFISKLAVEYAYVSYYSREDAYILAIILGCALIVDKSQNGHAEGVAVKESP